MDKLTAAMLPVGQLECAASLLPKRLEEWGALSDELRTCHLLAESGLFDEQYYLKTNPDVAAADIDPLLHYARYGIREKRNPSQWFDSALYAELYQDVAQSPLDPFVHFLLYGYKEGRKANANSLSHGINNATNYGTYDRYMQTAVRASSVLIAEPNTYSHAEVMPGYCKYFIELGYDVDVLLSQEQADKDPFIRTHLAGCRFYAMTGTNIDTILQSKKIQEYTYVLLTSHTVFREKKGEKWASIFELCPNVLHNNNILCLTHNFDKFDQELSAKGKYLILSNFPIQTGLNATCVNAHYFGKIQVSSKNIQTVKFIIIGGIEAKRRNIRLLFDAVTQLVAKNITNFSITVASASLDSIPATLRSYFNILSPCRNAQIEIDRVNFSTMYSHMEEADFFLPLLDPDNPEHDRYISTGTSGSFQLMYGFRKPGLIAEKFAEPHGFNTGNSIIYRHNNNFALAMERAVAMSSESYARMQSDLDILARDMYNLSLNNLSNLLHTINGSC